MIPPTNNNDIINPQYPRQKAPCSTPITKAPLEPGRRFSVGYFEGFRQCCRHNSSTAVIDKALRKSIFLHRQVDLLKISASETQSLVIPVVIEEQSQSNWKTTKQPDSLPKKLLLRSRGFVHGLIIWSKWNKKYWLVPHLTASQQSSLPTSSATQEPRSQGPDCR